MPKLGDAVVAFKEVTRLISHDQKQHTYEGGKGTFALLLPPRGGRPPFVFLIFANQLLSFLLVGLL